MKNQVVKIKATGKVAWAVALGAIGIAIYALPSTGAGFVPGFATVASTASAAVSILGLSATIAAVSICLGARSTKALKALYNDYKIVEKNSRYIKISKK